MEKEIEKKKAHIDVLKFFTKLSLQIVILFFIAIMYSFLTQYLQSIGFFGDIKLVDSTNGGVDKYYEWGTRHYLFFWMSLILFLIQFIRIIVFGIVEGKYTFDSDGKEEN